jgi:3-oxoacyl-[acyl-carrier protein] reductase
MEKTRKSALITGGSRGIGRAVSLRLARDGFHVLINYRSNDKEAAAAHEAITANGGTAQLCRFDVTDRAVASAAVDELLKENNVEALVLCAGVRADSLMVFMPPEQWDSIINANLTSFYNVVKPVVKHMVLNRAGRIVVVSSTSGETGLPGQVHYSASKAGLIGAVKALALECAKRNVLVNAVTPGFIATDMTADLDIKQLASRVPLNRLGTADEVAGAVSFLISPDSGYITGQVIRVNGGIYM